VWPSIAYCENRKKICESNDTSYEQILKPLHLVLLHGEAINHSHSIYLLSIRRNAEGQPDCDDSTQGPFCDSRYLFSDIVFVE